MPPAGVFAVSTASFAWCLRNQSGSGRAIGRMGPPNLAVMLMKLAEPLGESWFATSHDRSTFCWITSAIYDSPSRGPAARST